MYNNQFGDDCSVIEYSLIFGKHLQKSVHIPDDQPDISTSEIIIYSIFK